MKKLTPVILVDEIEPCIPFWSERLGFQVTMTVPEGDKLGFAILVNGPVEVMYQSRASVANDVPALAADPFGSRTHLFIEVESLQEFLPRVQGAPVVVPLRKTFYGSEEIGIRAPCGTTVVLAEFPKEES
jgi:uncharacterized glyoxalase superfamily protein PhnB